MFKRIITGLVLFAVFLLAVIFDSPVNWLAFFMVLACSISTLEFYSATKVTKNPFLTIFGVVASCIIVVSALLPESQPYVLIGFLVLSLLWLVIKGTTEDTGLWQWTLAGIIYLGFMLSYVLAVRELDNGIGWVFFIGFATFANDVFAFFVGSLWRGKKHLLAPKISPSKSIEGAIGGLVGAMILTVTVAWLGGLPISLFWAALFGLLIGALAIVGDLVESRFKRYTQIKDASDALPGHGGVMDRMDSWILAFPVSYFILILFVV